VGLRVLSEEEEKVNRNDFLQALAHAWTQQVGRGEEAEVVYTKAGDVNYVRLKVGVGADQVTFDVAGAFDAGIEVNRRMGVL